MEDTLEKNVSDYGDDEWLRVMSYLTILERISLSRVCRRWKYLADTSLKSVAVINGNTCHANKRGCLSKLAMALIIRKCCNAKHINLNCLGLFDGEHRSDNHCDHDILLSIAENCHQLQTIDFGLLEIDESFADIANNCKQIKRLSSMTIDDSALNLIIDSPVLESVNVLRNDNIVGNEFHRFGANIRELYINDCARINEDSIKKLCEGNGKLLNKLSIDVKNSSTLSLVCNHLLKLSELKLSISCLSCDFSEMSLLKQLRLISLTIEDPEFNLYQFKDFIQSLNGKNVLQIEIYLPFGSSDHINDNSLELLRKCCPNIEKLVLRRVSGITDAGMYQIAQLKSLKHLDLMNCDRIGNGVDIIITSCPALRQLILHNCSLVGPPVLDVFIEKCKTNANELFTLDVIDSCIPLDVNRETPPNMTLLLEYDDCKYDCDHGWGFHGDGDSVDSFGHENYEFEDCDDFEQYDGYDCFGDDNYDDDEEEEYDDFWPS